MKTCPTARWLFLIATVTVLIGGSVTYLNSCLLSEESAAAEIATQDPQELKILSATPEGLVAGIDQFYSIVVVFNKPMVPLQALPEGNGSGPLVIRPFVKGKFRWMGTNTLSFTPTDRLSLATRYDITIPAGTTSTTGIGLRADHKWGFETARPALIKSNIYKDAQGVTIDPTLYLLFNQKMDVTALRDGVELQHDPSGHSVPITLDVGDSIRMSEYLEKYAYSYYYDEQGAESSQNIAGRLFVATLHRSLDMSTSYTIVVRAGIKGLEGDLGTADRKDIQFRTYGPLTIDNFSEPGHPNGPLKLKFSNSVAASELREHVSIIPDAELIDVNEMYWDENFSTSIYYKLKPRTAYEFRISGKVADQFGNKLGEDYVRRFQTADFAPGVYFPRGSHILESYLSHDLNVSVLNPGAMSVNMAKLNPLEVIRLVREDYQWNSVLNFNQWTVTSVLSNDLPKNQQHLIPIHLDAVLGKDPGGVVLVEFWHDLDQGQHPGRAIVQVTDIGITAKFSKLSNLVYVSSLQDGKPLAGAQVRIMDDEGIIRFTGATDAKGLLQTPGWESLAMKSKNQWSEPTQWVFVTHAGQEAFSNSEARVELYRFNIPWNWSVPTKDRTEGYVFTNQGIYRPGDKVLIKGLLRRIHQDALHVAFEEAVKVVISNPSYEEVVSRELTANAFGAFDLEYDVSANADLGYYSIRVALGGEDVCAQNFQIQEFRPVETEVVVTTKQPHYVWGEKLKATLDAHYLFGMPISHSDVSWSATRTKTNFEPEGYDDYYFGDSPDDYYYSWEGRYSYGTVLSSGVARLNERGIADVIVDLEAGARNETSTLVLEGTVQDKNRQTVSGRKSVYIHAGSYYLGLRPSTTFLSIGNPLSVELVAVKPGGAKTTAKNLTVELVRREWISVREKSSDGAFYWTSQMKDSIEATEKLNAKSGIMTISFKPAMTGYYVVRASGVDEYGNQIRSTCYTYVTGAGYAGWRMTDDDAVDLVLNKKSFDPGDKAKILVKSPYDRCRALVTVERDGVLSHQTVELRGNSDMIEVPVTKDMIPNAYVSVILLKGRTELPTRDRQEDLGKPGFKIGYAKLAVNADENRLHVDVKTSSNQYSPGDWVDVDLATRDNRGKGQPAEVTLYVQDIGVLNLSNYKTPQPFDHFYRHRDLSVTTSESRRYILDQVVLQELRDKGGVGGGGGEGAYASVAIRRDFRSCVYWNPGVLTDASGKAHVRFQLPDNLTGFKIIAVAHTRESRFGSAEKNITVSKQLMLRPTLPRFARVGDQMEAGVIVHNYSDRDDSVRVVSTVNGLILRDEPLRTVFLKKSGSEEIRYRFHVKNSGTAVFTFRAVMNGLTDGVEITIPLRIPSYTETVALYGSATENHREDIVVPGQIYAEYGGLDVRTSSTAFVDLDGSMKYLFDYPYGCLEQKTSRVLPIILFGDVVQAFGFDKIGNEGHGIDETVQAYLDEVPKYQTYGGGFSYWVGGEHESPYVSVYAMFALIKAKEKGYAVSSDCYDKGIGYLKKIVRNSSPDPYGLFYWHMTNTFALAVLAEAGYYDAPTAELLYQRRDELPVYAQTMLLKAIAKGGGNRTMAEELKRRVQNAIKMTATTAHFEEPVSSGLEYAFHSNIRTTAAVLQTFVEMEGDRVPWAEKVVRYILQERKIDRWRTTQENVYVFWALGSYFRAFERENPDFTSEVLLDGRNVLTELYKGRSLKAAQNRISLVDLRKDTPLPLEFNKSGAGRLYYTARLTYAPALKAGIRPRDEGLAVEKSFADASGVAVSKDRFRAGEMYTVTIKVRTPQDRHFVVVDDPLPAGFEAINVNLATSGAAAKYQTTSASDSYWSWWDQGTFNNSEMRDDRVLLFADRLKSGTHTFTYLVRATTYGSFALPVTKAEEMYNPDIFGNTDSRIVVVE